MPQSEARAWWADVQHLREGYDQRDDESRRRSDRDDLAARRAARGRHGIDADLIAPAPEPVRLREVTREAQAHEVAPDVQAREAAVIAAPARRTVEIRGHTVPAPAVPRSDAAAADRRPPRRSVERVGARPERMAMWALVMGIFLILVAYGTA